MNRSTKEKLLSYFQADELVLAESIQVLWSGYGMLNRYHLLGSPQESIIIKEIDLGEKTHHPRGWNSEFSHQRKLKSYRVEWLWYNGLAKRCGDQCRVPDLYFSDSTPDRFLLVLEDLDQAGFSKRLSKVSIEEIKRGLDWLAHFHAEYMGESPIGLWEKGSYWHLETRPDEWDQMEEGLLKKNAKAIDERLSNAQYQTLIHGDAKLANFCFSSDHKQLAAVDFQYVGRGVGMKDVAYFLSSCSPVMQWQEKEEELLEYYFQSLKTAIKQGQKSIDFNALKKEWLELYPIAWADFIRFLKGWMPDHWKIDKHSEEMVGRGIEAIL